MKWWLALILILGVVYFAIVRKAQVVPPPAPSPAVPAPIEATSSPAPAEVSPRQTSPAGPATLPAPLPAPAPNGPRDALPSDQPFVVDGVTRTMPFKLNTEVGPPAPPPAYPVDSEVGHIEAGPFAPKPPPLNGQAVKTKAGRQ